MSFMHNDEIPCPKCGKTFEIERWDSINSEISPELIDKVVDGSFFRFKCPHCGEETIHLYPLLINVMTPEGGLIKLTGDPKEEAKEIAGMYSGLDPQMAALMKKAAPKRYRFVNYLPDLVEKVELFRAGIDDRTIEIVKLFLFKALKAKGVDADQILWFKDGEDGKAYWAAGNKEKQFFMPFQQEAFKGMEDLIRSKDPRWEEDNRSTYIVNGDWALDWVKNFL
jgi:predicted RNA-binding Zn-ribbon protein involved in translation (DUF1610 family)